MITCNIEVVGPDLNWIAGRLARELVARLPGFGISAAINSSSPADLEYQQIVYGPPTGRAAKSVGLFTHGTVRPNNFTHDYDGHVALNPRMAELLRSHGAKHPVVIEQAVDSCFTMPHAPIFGVAGRCYGDGRKGEALVRKMMEAGYDVRAHGSGWPCQISGTSYETLANFYRNLDYYVVTSSDEGGCSPIIECMAMGIPVIAPRIGFGIVRPILEYAAGDWASLSNVLWYLTHHRTYDDWAKDHAVYFREVLGVS